MELFTNAADLEQEWVRAFLLRLGYMLAAEYQFMPACELRDIVGNHANDFIDLSEMHPKPEPPPLRVV